MTDAQVATAITNIADGTPNTAAELRALFTELFNRAPKTGTIVIKDVSNAYITANFDGTGKGINLEEGYALVNGANGTRNWAGRVPVAYGTGYTTMGESLGNKDAVVVEHSHTYNSINNVGKAVLAFDSVGDKEGASYFTANTNTVGASGTDKNMQPYIINLYIMKL